MTKVLIAIGVLIGLYLVLERANAQQQDPTTVDPTMPAPAPVPVWVTPTINTPLVPPPATIVIDGRTYIYP